MPIRIVRLTTGNKTEFAAVRQRVQAHGRVMRVCDLRSRWSTIREIHKRPRRRRPVSVESVAPGGEPRQKKKKRSFAHTYTDNNITTRFCCCSGRPIEWKTVVDPDPKSEALVVRHFLWPIFFISFFAPGGRFFMLLKNNVFFKIFFTFVQIFRLHVLGQFGSRTKIFWLDTIEF